MILEFEKNMFRIFHSNSFCQQHSHSDLKECLRMNNDLILTPKAEFDLTLFQFEHSLSCLCLHCLEAFNCSSRFQIRETASITFFTFLLSRRVSRNWIGPVLL